MLEMMAAQNKPHILCTPHSATSDRSDISTDTKTLHVLPPTNLPSARSPTTLTKHSLSWPPHLLSFHPWQKPKDPGTPSNEQWNGSPKSSIPCTVTATG